MARPDYPAANQEISLSETDEAGGEKQSRLRTSEGDEERRTGGS